MNKTVTYTDSTNFNYQLSIPIDENNGLIGSILAIKE